MEVQSSTLLTRVSLRPQEGDDSNGTFLIVAEGEVNSSGWSNPRLLPYTYVRSPEDGMWGFDFVADAPSGISRPVLTPIRAEYLMKEVPEGFNGVRVHAATNFKEAAIK